jgi:hypothetical protein
MDMILSSQCAATLQAAELGVINAEEISENLTGVFAE